MPLWTPSSKHAYRIDNWGADPTSTPGTSVVPGVAAEGSWTEVLSDIATQFYGLYVRVADGATSGATKSHLMDIGWDPAGGTSYVEKIVNIVCGASGVTNNANSGSQFFFPIRVPAGAAIAVRFAGSNATPGTVRVCMRGYGQPSAPWLLPYGQYSETIGTISGIQGVTFTPGTTADGTWVSLGTTARDLWWWQLATQVSLGGMTLERTYIDLAVGDATNKTIILHMIHAHSAAEQSTDLIPENLIWHACYFPVKAGSELWVRGRCEDTPDTGYNAVAIGIGG